MKVYFLFLFLALISACNSSKKSDPIEEVSPDDFSLCSLYSAPKDLKYAQSSINISRNSALQPLYPTYNSGLPVTFRTNPELPAGLNFSLVTGEFSGIPVAAQSERTYEFIIANECGSSVFPIKIKINELPPSSIAYSGNDFSVNIGDNFPIISPVVNGVVDLFSISPDLPIGMSLDPTTGVISGKPFVSQVKKNHVITAINSGGSKSVTISVEVKGKAPSQLSYKSQTAVYKAGEDIELNYPLYSGDAADNFTITPSLPEGLSLNQQTGRISGNPEVPITNQQYTIVASNVWGSASALISLSVLNHINDIGTGLEHTCVIKNRKVYCQGKNDKFQLGYASSDQCSDILNDEYNCSKTLNPIINNGSMLKAKQLATGLQTSCILGLDSKVYCWGDNQKGQTGSGLNDLIVTAPMPVKSSGQELNNIVSIKAGYEHFCALNSQQQVYCWGDNSKFQLNSPILVYSNNAILTEIGVSDFALGAKHTCVIKNSLPFCVGENQFYQLANGINQDSSSFILAEKFEASFSIIDKIWGGASFTIFKESNNFFASGSNIQGELGIGNFNSNSIAAEIFIDKSPSQIVSGGAPESFSMAISGGPSICFIENGLGFCQGKNDNNFANPINLGAAQPNAVPILENVSIPFVNIERISQGYSNHRCLSRNGSLFCFGQNYMGQVSSDSDVVKPYPVEVLFP